MKASSSKAFSARMTVVQFNARSSAKATKQVYRSTLANPSNTAIPCYRIDAQAGPGNSGRTASLDRQTPVWTLIKIPSDPLG